MLGKLTCHLFLPQALTVNYIVSSLSTTAEPFYSGGANILIVLTVLVGEDFAHFFKEGSIPITDLLACDHVQVTLFQFTISLG
jgi:hypothetical protein